MPRTYTTATPPLSVTLVTGAPKSVRLNAIAPPLEPRLTTAALVPSRFPLPSTASIVATNVEPAATLAALKLTRRSVAPLATLVYTASTTLPDPTVPVNASTLSTSPAPDGAVYRTVIRPPPSVVPNRAVGVTVVVGFGSAGFKLSTPPAGSWMNTSTRSPLTALPYASSTRTSTVSVVPTVTFLLAGAIVTLAPAPAVAVAVSTTLAPVPSRASSVFTPATVPNRHSATDTSPCPSVTPVVSTDPPATTSTLPPPPVTRNVTTAPLTAFPYPSRTRTRGDTPTTVFTVAVCPSPATTSTDDAAAATTSMPADVVATPPSAATSAYDPARVLATRNVTRPLSEAANA